MAMWNDSVWLGREKAGNRRRKKAALSADSV